MPGLVQATVRVHGYREITRAFGKADKAVKGEMQDAFRDVAEPIRAQAEALALTRISHIGRRWGLMRIGLTTNVVYVAPRERGKASRVNRMLGRPNLAELLISRSMQPALDANEGKVEERFDEATRRIERIWDRA